MTKRQRIGLAQMMLGTGIHSAGWILLGMNVGIMTVGVLALVAGGVLFAIGAHAFESDE